MSNITTIYDNIDTILSALFSAKTEIPNPRKLSDNNENYLKDGYGFYFAGAGLPSFDLSHFQGYSREIVIVLARNIYRVDNDTSVYKTAEKNLLEDQVVLINSLADDRTMDDLITSVEFTGDSGVEFTFDDKYNFMYLSTTFDLEYKQDVSYCL